MMERSFSAGALHLRDDGRTVEGRIVPYNEPADIAEIGKDGSIVRYREQFLPRSCMAMAQAIAKRGNAAFMALLLEHEEHDLDAKIGYATELRDERDGAYATFRLYESRDMDKVQSMLRESHTGLSVHFGDTRPPKLVDDVVSRVQVHIDHVAATPTPCYAGAGITAMRSEIVPVEVGTPHLDEIQAWLTEIRKVPT